MSDKQKSSFHPDAGEDVLLTVDVGYMRGVISFSGVATLTERRLHYSPSKVNRAIGVSSWEIFVSSIESVDLAGVERTLEVVTPEKKYRLMGKGSRQLYSRLASIMDERGMMAFDSVQFEPGERVLLQGTTRRYMNTMLATPGDLTLTDCRIRFEPTAGLESVLWSDQEFDIPIDDIEEVKVVGLRRRLRVVTFGGDTFLLGGPLMPRVYGLLAVLCDEGSMSNVGSQVMACWKAQYHRGALACGGELAATVRSVRFTPSGVLDAFVGMPDEIVIEWGDVTRIFLKGVMDRRIHIKDSEQEFTFSTADTPDRFVDFVQLLIQGERPDDPPVNVDGQVDLDVHHARIMKLWAEKGVRQSKVVLMGPAVHRANKQTARPGWLVLTETDMLFLPAGGPTKKETHIAVPVEMLGRYQPTLTPPAELHLEVGDKSVRFMPRGGLSFVDKFWALWRILGPVTAAMEAKVKEMEPEEEEVPLPEEDDGDGMGLFRRPKNRRKAFRVVLPIPVPIKVTTYRPPHGLLVAELKARLTDISVGGCAIVCLHEIEEDLSIGLEIPHMGEVLNVRASIARIQKPRRRERYWRYGFRYSSLSPYDEEQVVETVMDLQRAELTRRADLKADSIQDDEE